MNYKNTLLLERKGRLYEVRMVFIIVLWALSWPNNYITHCG